MRLLPIIAAISLIPAAHAADRLNVGASIGDGTIIITNLDKTDWHDCNVQLIPTKYSWSAWEIDLPVIHPGPVTLALRDFAMNGVRFDPIANKAVALYISCGSAEHIASQAWDLN